MADEMKAYAVSVIFGSGRSFNSVSLTVSPEMAAMSSLFEALKGTPAMLDEERLHSVSVMPIREDWLRSAYRAVIEGQSGPAPVLSLVPDAPKPERRPHEWSTSYQPTPGGVAVRLCAKCGLLETQVLRLDDPCEGAPEHPLGGHDWPEPPAPPLAHKWVSRGEDSIGDYCCVCGAVKFGAQAAGPCCGHPLAGRYEPPPPAGGAA